MKYPLSIHLSDYIDPIGEIEQQTPTAITIDNTINDISSSQLQEEIELQKLSVQDLQVFYEEQPKDIKQTLLSTKFLKQASEINKNQLPKSMSLKYIKGIKLNYDQQAQRWEQEQLTYQNHHRRTRNQITGNQLISSAIDTNQMTTTYSITNDQLNFSPPLDSKRKVKFSDTLISINNDKSVNLIIEKDHKTNSNILEMFRNQQMLQQDSKIHQKISRNGLKTSKTQLTQEQRIVLMNLGGDSGCLENQKFKQNQNKLNKNKMQRPATNDNLSKNSYRIGPKIDYGQNMSPPKITKKLSVFDRLHSGLKRQVLEYQDSHLKLSKQNGIDSHQTSKQLSNRKTSGILLSPRNNKMTIGSPQRVQMFQTSPKKKPISSQLGTMSIVQKKIEQRTMQSNPVTRNVSPQRVSKNEMEELVQNYKTDEASSLKMTTSQKSIEKMRRQVDAIMNSPAYCQSPKSRQSSGQRANNVILRLSNDSQARQQKQKYLQQFSGLSTFEIQQLNQKRTQQGFRSLKQRYISSQSNKSIRINNIYGDSNSTSKMELNTDFQTRQRGDSNYFQNTNTISQQFDVNFMFQREKSNTEYQDHEKLRKDSTNKISA